ncbi:MAG: DUF3793 family protein [Spirochaetaceae bacterium]|nr:DUF3793 family protein [Spirochaetaceae bacterium]
MIIRHCSPVLLGCKPAALFALGTDDPGLLSGFMPPGTGCMVVRRQKAGLLVFLFDRAMLEKTVLDDPIHGTLVGMGYPPGGSLSVFLAHLQRRFEYQKCPHEVGLFLGYPLDDVLGFIRHRGSNYKLCGVWKVYGDPELAKKQFRQYELCRNRMESYFRGSAGSGRRALPLAANQPRPALRRVYTS